jgi:hypothetical protein
VKGRVRTVELHRAAYNALQYSNKNSALKGDVIWIRGAHGLRVVATDDYFILVDQVDALEYSGKPETRVMNLAGLKELEKLLRGDNTEWMDLDLLDLSEPNDVQWSTQSLLEADRLVFDSDKWKESTATGFALAPDRLRRLALVKPGEHPIDIKVFENDGEQMLAFRIGPTVRGLIAPLNRDTLRGIYDGEELWG